MSFWGTIFGSDSDVDRIAAADKGLADLNATRDARGIVVNDWTPADQRFNNDTLDGTAYTQESVAAGYATDLKTGVAEGADNIRGALNSAAGFGLSTIWRAVPWWAWLLLLVALAIYTAPIWGGLLNARKASR